MGEAVAGQIVDLRRLACEARGGHRFKYDGGRFQNWPLCERCGASKREIAKAEFVAQWNARKQAK